MPLADNASAIGRTDYVRVAIENAHAVPLATSGASILSSTVRAAGAVVQTGETVLDWESNGQRVRVRTDRGEYEAARLVVTAGAWAGSLLGDLGVPFRVTRKLLFWHEVTTGDYNLANGASAFYFDLPAGAFYGFPSLDGKTVKVARPTGATTSAPTFCWATPTPRIARSTMRAA